jgi:hypothetical protein
MRHDELPDAALDRPLVDSRLRCPACDYNLTGIVEHRCPECGSSFDPEELRARLRGAPSPIPVWDGGGKSIVLRFVRMCVFTWFLPARVGRTFPASYSSRSALMFRWIALILALGLYWMPEMAPHLNGTIDMRSPEFRLTFCICALVGIFCCEGILCLSFRAALGRRVPLGSNGVFRDTDASNSWRGFLGMFRSFVLISVVFQQVSLIRNLLDYVPFQLLPIPNFIPPYFLTAIIWWWVALGVAVAAHPTSRPHNKLWAIFISIPIAAAASIAVGFILGVFLVQARRW